MIRNVTFCLRIVIAHLVHHFDLKGEKMIILRLNIKPLLISRQNDAPYSPYCLRFHDNLWLVFLDYNEMRLASNEHVRTGAHDLFCVHTIEAYFMLGDLALLLTRKQSLIRWDCHGLQLTLDPVEALALLSHQRINMWSVDADAIRTEIAQYLPLLREVLKSSHFKPWFEYLAHLFHTNNDLLSTQIALAIVVVQNEMRGANAEVYDIF